MHHVTDMRISQDFWHEMARAENAVPWEQFMTAFGPYAVGATEGRLKALHDVVVENGEVTLKRFGQMVGWFGPMELGAGVITRVRAHLAGNDCCHDDGDGILIGVRVVD